jgi:hypothetical protein
MSRKITTDVFINDAKNIHGNRYNYSKTKYINRVSKIKVICPIHGKFIQTAHDHLCGCGCKKCSAEKLSILFRKNKREFIKKAKGVHKNKYDYSIVDYKNAIAKIKIVCPLHGIFLQRPQSHLEGCGCKYCGIEKVSKTKRMNMKQFLIRANKIHKNKYNYLNTNYINNDTKIRINCPFHDTFFQTPMNHLKGRGCPRCSYYVSKPEIQFLNYLKIPNIKSNRQVFILGKKVDGIKNNVIYEFLGDYWHGNPKIYNKNDINKANKTKFGDLYDSTIKKFKMLKQNGYSIKYIWESDWDLWNKNQGQKIPLLEF